MFWTSEVGASGVRDGTGSGAASIGGLDASAGFVGGTEGLFGSGVGFEGAGAGAFPAVGALTLALCPHATSDKSNTHTNALAAKRQALDSHLCV